MRMTRDEVLTAEEVEGKDKLKQEAEESAKQNCPMPVNWNEIDIAERAGYIKGYIAGAEPREKRIAELETDFQCERDIAMELAEHLGKANDKVADLEKENAELKKLKRECETSLCRAEYQYNYEQLTKAKEIIREFMKYEINEYDGSLEIHFEELKKQAEQFLSEVEK